MLVPASYMREFAAFLTFMTENTFFDCWLDKRSEFEDAISGLWENVMSIFHHFMTLITVEGSNLPFS